MASFSINQTHLSTLDKRHTKNRLRAVRDTAHTVEPFWMVKISIFRFFVRGANSFSIIIILTIKAILVQIFCSHFLLKKIVMYKSLPLPRGGKGWGCFWEVQLMHNFKTNINSVSKKRIMFSTQQQKGIYLFLKGQRVWLPFFFQPAFPIFRT